MLDDPPPPLVLLNRNSFTEHNYKCQNVLKGFKDIFLVDPGKYLNMRSSDTDSASVFITHPLLAHVGICTYVHFFHQIPTYINFFFFNIFTQLLMR